jgi:hypothetical protein
LDPSTLTPPDESRTLVKVSVSPPETVMPIGEFAGAVSVPKYPVTVEPLGCPASQISVVAATVTTVSARAGKLASPIASETRAADKRALDPAFNFMVVAFRVWLV